VIPPSVLVLLPVAGAGAIFLLPQIWPVQRVTMFDAGIRIVVLLACLALFLVEDEPEWPDALSLLTANLVAILSALVGLSHLRRRSRSRLACSRDLAVIGGLLLIALATDPLLVWLALVLTVVAARVAQRPGGQRDGQRGHANQRPDGSEQRPGEQREGQRGGQHPGGGRSGTPDAEVLDTRVRDAGTRDPGSGGLGFRIAAATKVLTLPAGEGEMLGRPGLVPASNRLRGDSLVAGCCCLILFGQIALPSASTLLALGCLLLGQAMLVVMVPVLLPLVMILVLRFRAVAALTHDAALTDTMLIALGLGTALACAAMLLMRPRARDRLTLLHIGQTGIGVFAFGLGTAEAMFAGLIHLLLLAVTWTAAEVSDIGRPERLAAIAGLAGLPPFGVWPGLVLIILATAHRSVWLLLALSLALGLIAWATVVRLPSRRWTRPAVPTLAWVPLAVTVLLGLAMPDVVAAWLRGLAVVPG